MEPAELELRAIATRRVRAKRSFMAHLASCAIVNAALAAIWALTGAGYPWFLWPLLGWGIGLAFHGVGLLVSLSTTSPAGVDRETRAIEREIAGCAAPL